MSTPSETGPSGLPLSVLGRVDEAGDRFEDAWEAGRRPAIEAFLAAVPEPERPVLLHELLRVELGYRRRGGEAPTPAEYRDRFPDHTAVIRDAFDAAGTPASSTKPPMARLDTPPEPGTTPRAGAVSWPTIPGYEILGELGRGGMGVVYRARHTRLDRLVALKMVRAGAQASAEELARFRAEAALQARLQHPHIVQIFEIGETTDGPYFALELVDGPSLDHHLGGTPRPALAAAQLVETLARAVHHAHQKGLVHRDLKPGNILLAADGTPKVGDFGLAKRLEGEAGQTQSGAVLGTPSYMAPEQAWGRPKDICPATDVYALGAILYALLTGRPPFLGANTLDTVLQVRYQEPVPPRRLLASVPRDLETICLKCLHKEPPRRYATAQELAEDLRRYRAGEPIVARPVGIVEQGLKWIRRRPTAAALAGLLLLVLVGGAVGGVLLARQQAARQRQLETALERIDGLRGPARARGGAAARAEARALAKGAEDLLEQGPVGGELARRVRTVLAELAEEERVSRLVTDLEEARLQEARLRLRVASVKDRRAAIDESALRAYEEKFRAYGLAVGETDPAEAAARLRGLPESYRTDLVAALDDWLDLAERKQAEGLAWLRRVVAEADPDDWRARLRTARAAKDRPTLERLARAADTAAQPPATLQLLGWSLVVEGAPETAIPLLQRAQERYPDDLSINQTLAWALAQCGQWAEAARFFTVVVALRPLSPAARTGLGVVLTHKRDLEGAVAAFRRALELQPDDTDSLIHYDLGTVLLEKGDLDGAVAAFRRALELQPDDADTLTNLGNALRGKGDLEEAIAAYRRALDHEPDHALAHLNLGVAYVDNWDLDEAVTAFRRARELDAKNFRTHFNLGAVFRYQGRFVDSLAAYQRAYELGAKEPNLSDLLAQPVREVKRLIELDGKLDAFYRGEYQPKDSAEQLGLAEICRTKQRYQTAARLCAAAFAAEPKLADDLWAQHRYDAACCAALAATGRSAEADKVDDQERARWRQQALEWLRAELAGYAKLLEGGQDRAVVQGWLRQWQRTPELAGLRDPKALARLPGDEQAAWQKLWADVAALLRRSQGEG